MYIVHWVLRVSDQWHQRIAPVLSSLNKQLFRALVPPTRCMRPLPDTHPEFTVVYWPGFTEYRVENWRLARDGSGRIVRGTCAWSWLDPALVVVLALLARFEVRRCLRRLGVAGSLVV